MKALLKMETTISQILSNLIEHYSPRLEKRPPNHPGCPLHLPLLPHPLLLPHSPLLPPVPQPASPYYCSQVKLLILEYLNRKASLCHPVWWSEMRQKNIFEQWNRFCQRCVAFDKQSMFLLSWRRFLCGLLINVLWCPRKKTTTIEHVLHCSLLARGEFSKGPWNLILAINNPRPQFSGLVLF